MQIYIEDFVEDLNYRKVILSIGGVDSEKLYSSNYIRGITNSCSR